MRILLLLLLGCAEVSDDRAFLCTLSRDGVPLLQVERSGPDAETVAEELRAEVLSRGVAFDVACEEWP